MWVAEFTLGAMGIGLASNVEADMVDAIALFAIGACQAIDASAAFHAFGQTMRPLAAIGARFASARALVLHAALIRLAMAVFGAFKASLHLFRANRPLRRALVSLA